jgi:hypothetical protein
LKKFTKYDDDGRTPSDGNSSQGELIKGKFKKHKPVIKENIIILIYASFFPFTTRKILMSAKVVNET